MKKILKVIFSLIVLAFLAVKIEWRQLWTIVLSARFEILIATAVEMFIENMLVAWRWMVLLAPVGVVVSFMEAFQSYLKGNFVSYFVPAAVTGDVVKAVDLNRAHSKGVEVLSSIFMERCFGALSVSVMVILGLLNSPILAGHGSTQKSLLLSAAAVIAACFLAFFIDKFFFLAPPALLNRFPKAAHWVARAEQSFVTYRQNHKILAWMMLLSLAIQLLRVTPIYLTALALGQNVKFYPFMIAVPVIYLLNMLPVVGSRIGTEQGMFVLLLGISGIDAEASMAIALVSLVVGLITVLPGGYWLFKGRQHPSVQRES